MYKELILEEIDRVKREIDLEIQNSKSNTDILDLKFKKGVIELYIEKYTKEESEEDNDYKGFMIPISHKRHNPTIPDAYQYLENNNFYLNKMYGIIKDMIWWLDGLSAHITWEDRNKENSIRESVRTHFLDFIKTISKQ